MEGMNTTGRKLTASKLYEVSRVFINVDTDGNVFNYLGGRF